MVVSLGNVEEPWTYSSGSKTWIANGSVNLGVASATALDSPEFTLTRSGAVTLRVHHRFNFEIWNSVRFDGGQIRFRVNGGSDQTVSSFSQNGYDGTMGGNNMLKSEPVFTKSTGYDSGLYVESVANLGTFQAGDRIAIRLLGAWDNADRAGIPNWQVDRVLLVEEAPLPVAVSSSSTEVFMANATTLSGNGGSGTRVTYFSMKTRKPAVRVGTVTSRVAGSIIDSTANWADDAFNGANGRHYIEFENGVTADIEDTFAGTHSIRVPGTLPASVTAGLRYRIRPHTTLGDIFGYNNETGLSPGPNANQADNVLFYAGDAQQTMTFFYSSVSGYIGWYRSDYTPADDMVVYPEQGIIVRRRSAPNLQVTNGGQPLSTPLVVPVYMGFNILGTLQSTRNIALNDLNLVTGDSASGLAPGVNFTEADNLVVINADSTASTYFYSNYAGFEGWYSSSYQAAGNVTISPGAVFFVQRKAPRAMFEWSIPMEVSPTP